MSLTIGLTFDLKQDYPQEISSAVDDDCELDSPETIDSIASALEKSGHRVFKLGGGRNLLQALEHRVSAADVIPPDAAGDDDSDPDGFEATFPRGQE